MAIGGWRRLAAPLFIGTALTATALVAATGHRLAVLPVWVGIAVGGVALLLLAALIEQRVDDDTTGEPGERLVEAVWNRFA